MPVSVIVFGPDDTTLAKFTTDGEELTKSVSQTPETSEGTHIYDALVGRRRPLATRGSGERRSSCSPTARTWVARLPVRKRSPHLRARAQRVYSVGLRSPQYDPEALASVARRSGGATRKLANPAELAAIFTEIGTDLASEYEVTYRLAAAAERPRQRRPDGRRSDGHGEVHDPAADALER